MPPQPDDHDHRRLDINDNQQHDDGAEHIDFVNHVIDGGSIHDQFVNPGLIEHDEHHDPGEHLDIDATLVIEHDDRSRVNDLLKHVHHGSVIDFDGTKYVLVQRAAIDNLKQATRLYAAGTVSARTLLAAARNVLPPA